MKVFLLVKVFPVSLCTVIVQTMALIHIAALSAGCLPVLSFCQTYLGFDFSLRMSEKSLYGLNLDFIPNHCAELGKFTVNRR